MVNDVAIMKGLKKRRWDFFSSCFEIHIFMPEALIISLLDGIMSPKMKQIMALIEFVPDSKYKLITSHKKSILLFPAYYIKKKTIYLEAAS